MTFREAVRTCLGKYAVLEGRARRPEYWWFALFGWIGAAVMSALDRVLLGPDMGLFGVIFALAMVLPFIGVGVRRLHDTGRSGWWLLLGLIPVIGTIVLIYFYVLPGSQGPNRYGPEPPVRPTGF